MYYQLLSFTPDASESDISFQVGVMQGVFSAAQIFTSVAWGRIADHPRWGRKRVILFSLSGQTISCIGVAFSSTFATAAIWRTLGGAVNATVGGARTALSEKTERKFHPRTFLLLPLAWNVANIVAPPICGVLSDPVKYYPAWFGVNSTFGGRDGVAWLKVFPYALPNLLCAFVLFADAALVWLGLEETLQARHGQQDLGLELGSRIGRLFRRHVLRRTGYTRLAQSETYADPDSALSIDDAESSVGTPLTNLYKEVSSSSLPSSPSAKPKIPAKPPPFSRVLTRNVLLVMSVVASLDFSLGGFTALWSIFLSTPVSDSTDKTPQPPFKFSGGIGFPPSTVGLAMSILGAVGIICQLSLYPSINARYGTLNSTRYALFFFPIAFSIAPYLSLLASSTSSSSNPGQILLWAGIISIAMLIISARTFAVPGIVLLTNNAAPGPETLGTIHGLGAAVSSAFKTLGPVVAGAWFAKGLEMRIVGYAWWCLAGVAAFGCIPIFWVRDGR